MVFTHGAEGVQFFTHMFAQFHRPPPSLVKNYQSLSPSDIQNNQSRLTATLGFRKWLGILYEYFLVSLQFKTLYTSKLYLVYGYDR